MFAAVHTTVLPEFSVEVYPTAEGEHAVHQRYVLVLRDGTVGAVELLFPSARDLQAFLTFTREAFAAAKQEAKARKVRSRQDQRGSSVQAYLF